MLNDKLTQYTGTSKYYNNPLYPGYVYTDGVRALCEIYKCYWILDYIFSRKIQEKFKDQPFLCWKFDVNTRKASAKVIVSDGNEPIKKLNVLYTDLEDSVELFMVDNVLHLPSEY